MTIALAVATLLGGVAAVWFFWDKIKFSNPFASRLNVKLEYRRKEVRPSVSPNTALIIWLWDVSLTNREPRPVQLSVEGCWKFPNGAERCAGRAFDSTDVSLQAYTGRQFNEMRFLLSNWDVHELGLADALYKARPFVRLRDRVTDRILDVDVGNHGRAA